jgi:CRP/FNR family transcriptional regulator, cyclic AMP receptor protein
VERPFWFTRTVKLRKNEKVELIASIPLFSDCSKKEIGAVAAIADEIDAREGVALVTQGERGREAFVIVEGSARVVRNGRRVADLGPGDVVGEMALVTDLPRNATVTATSAVHLLVVTERSFKHLLRDMPSVALNVLRTVARRAAENQKLGV